MSTAPHGHNDLDPGKVKVVKGLALAIGVVYLLIGLLGFFVTGFENFASETNETLLGFEINPLHNIVHVLIGAAGIALARTLGSLTGTSARSTRPGTTGGSSATATVAATSAGSPGRRSSVTRWSWARRHPTTRPWTATGRSGGARGPRWWAVAPRRC
jgi:uncharacterized membrane protein YuzA (DUF378 family)